MRSLIFIAALGVSTAAFSAAAQTTTPPATSSSTSTSSTAASTKTDSNDAATSKPICKSVTEGGTRIPKRECHTQAEWDQIRANAQDNLSDTSHPNSSPH